MHPSYILLIVSLILAILAAMPLPSPINLGWLAFAFYVGSLLIGR